MNNPDILSVFIEEEELINKEIRIGNHHEKNGRIEKAADNYRDAARLMVRKNIYPTAIRYYVQAYDLYISINKFLKAIHCLDTVRQIHELRVDLNSEADTFEKIASLYKHYTKDYGKAGYYYLCSARKHEDRQDYFSAFRKAEFAAECFGLNNSKGKYRDAMGLATRMALRARDFERAGEAAKKWWEAMDKGYSSHHLSICMKAYRSFRSAGRYKDSLFFLSELINAHYSKGVNQTAILKFLIEAQEMTLITKELFDIQLDNKIVNEFGKNYFGLANYYAKMKRICDENNIGDLSDSIILKMYHNRKSFALSKNNLRKYLSYELWNLTCSYGVSVSRWLLLSIITILVFGFVFAAYPCPQWYPESFKNILYDLSPSINISSVNNWFSPYYFSFVIFTTLGLGDITPANTPAQIFIVLEVMIGYAMLGGLISIFSRKIIR